MVTSFQGVLEFLRSRFGPRSRFYGHVPRIYVDLYPSRRYFYSSAPFAAKVSHNCEKYYVKSGYSPSAKFQTIVKSFSPSITKREDILKKLAGDLNQTGKQLESGSAPTVVILATPSFTGWLEGQSFIAGVLKFLFSSFKIQGHGPDITVIAAVVDGLPAISQKSARQNNEKNEGFAIMLWDRQSPLPSLEQINDGSDQHQTSHIIFSMNRLEDAGNSVEITVPLANTLFRTGRSSTLLISKWGSSARMLPHGVLEWEFSPQEPVRLNNITIRPDISPVISPLHFHVPLQILTPLREVVAGLGNIVRQVMGAEGNPVSASQELEASVDAYLTARKVENQAVNVWALIVPEALVQGKESACYDVERIRDSWTSESDDPQSHAYIDQRLQEGARLHRVLSGGGGWGLKQGLLSLDPDTTLIKNARYDFDSNSDWANDTNNQIHSLGNIAKPGSHIQFLISPPTTMLNEATEDSNPDSPLPATDVEKANFIFGCIPSTIDDMLIPLQSSEGSDFLPEKGREAAQIEVFDGVFGALSETGIFVRSGGGGDGGLKVDSKMDVPYSRVSWSGAGAAMGIRVGQYDGK